MAKSVKEPEAEEAPSKTKEKKAPARQSARESKARKPEMVLKVRHRKTMRIQQTYPLTVEVPRGKTKDEHPAPLVIVRAVVPGALVSPAEQRLDLAKKGDKATFFVTPLAKGPLPRARLEIFSPGQPMQELRLNMGTKTQRKTWLLLALTFLIPWGISRLVFGPNKLHTYEVGPNISLALKGDENRTAPFRGINLLAQKWKDAPEGLQDLDLIEELSTHSSTLYTMFYDWVEKDHGLAWIILGLAVLTALSWLWHRCWRGGRKMYFQLPDSTAEAGPATTLTPLA